MSCHFKPISSPRRIPVASASTNNASHLCPCMVVRNTCACSSVKGFISKRSLRGGVTRSHTFLESVGLPSGWERWSELGKDAVAGREHDEGLRAFGQPLMVAREPTPARDPGEGALDHPSSRQRAKAGGKELLPLDLLSFGNQETAPGHGEGAHRLHNPAQIDLHPGDHRASVVAISPQQLHAGKLLFEWRKQGSASFLIGALGSGHFDGQQMALAIHEGVSFAPPDFFSPYRSPFQDRAPHWF